MPTRVLILAPGADTGGGAIKIKQAFDRHMPDWEVRAVRRTDNYLRYPADLVWSPGRSLPAAVLEAWEAADLVHMVNNERLSRYLPGYASKPKVLQVRGRGNDAIVASAMARGIPVYASTPNLIRRGMGWLPNIGDGPLLAALADGHELGHPPVLVHAPTVRGVKGTAELPH